MSILFLSETPLNSSLRAPTLRPTDQHERRYNAPTSSEIAVIIPGSEDGNERSNPRDIIIKGKDGILQRISETHRLYDPLHYVLMYPTGEPGWQLDLKRNENSRKALSCREFYAYRLMWRGGNDFNILLRASKLTQQYIVDMYSCGQKKGPP